MRARWKWIIGVGVVLAVIQIIRPERSNPPVVTTETIHSKLTVEPAVSSTFAQSCNDCHSNLTVWPWYSNIAPASWLVVSDVRRGRAELNFSEWGTYSPKRQQEWLKGICSEASDREMPGSAYTLLHRSAKLTSGDIRTVCIWTQSFNQSPLTKEQ